VSKCCTVRWSPYSFLPWSRQLASNDTMKFRCLTLLVGLIQAIGCLGATVTYDWNVTWINASPDGFGRPVIGINGRWPCPIIEAYVGDTVVVNLVNQLGNETTGLHFHGITQRGSNVMDGPSGVVQCPCPPGNSLTYSFLVSRTYLLNYHVGLGN
jgi:iron transport multicopper oxidase